MAAERLVPAVVTVLVLRRPVNPADIAPGGGFFTLSGLPLPGGDELAGERSFSSGFVVAAPGDVVTSAHAVLRADRVFVVLADGRRLPATLVAADRRNDVALLRVDGATLPVARPATGTVCAGDVVAALGAPFGFQRTVTAGVVSAAARVLPGVQGVPLIQTDVAMNPGSSGGPLFDAEGSVVAMASMIYSDSGVYVGVSFAVPIDRVLRVADSLRTRGAPRADIGAVTQPLDDALAAAFRMRAPRGALVAAVQAGTPAFGSGLLPGDVIVGVRGSAVADQTEAEDAIQASDGTRPLELEVWRDGARRKLVVPADRAAATPEPPPQPQPEGRLGMLLTPGVATARIPAGVYVDTATGSALLAGVEPGDRIAAVNGTLVATLDEFDVALARAQAQPVVALLVLRAGTPLYLAVRRIGR